MITLINHAEKQNVTYHSKTKQVRGDEVQTKINVQSKENQIILGALLNVKGAEDTKHKTKPDKTKTK